MESTATNRHTQASSSSPMGSSAEMMKARLFWAVLLLALTAATILALLDLSAPWFKPVFYSRAALSFVAAVALLWSLSERRLPANAPSFFMLAALASHSFYTLSVGPVPALMDIAGVMFLICAFVYRGSMQVWWAFFLPVSMVLLFLPIAKLESSGAIQAGALIRFSLVPMLSLAGASLVAALRETRGRSLEARQELDQLAARNRGLVKDLRTLEHDMKSLLTLVRTFAHSGTHPATHSEEEEFAGLPETLRDQMDMPGFASMAEMTAVAQLADTAVNAKPIPSFADSSAPERISDEEWLAEVSEARVLSASESSVSVEEALVHNGCDDIECMDTVDVYQVLKETVDEVRSLLMPTKKVQMILNGPTEVSIPMSVRGDRGAARIAFRSLIALSIDALGGAEGVVRVGLRLGLGQMSVTIEDNGRGFSEAMIVKMESKGTMVRDPRLAKGFERVSLSEVRGVLEAMGARMEINARLGVGSRVTLDLPRIDAFARGRSILHGELTRAAQSSVVSSAVASSGASFVAPMRS